LPLSVCGLTQTPGIVPHFKVVGAGHAPHTPPVQVAPVAHAVPHPPQFAGSIIVSTHAPPHTVVVQPVVSLSASAAVSATDVSAPVSSVVAPVSPAPVSSGGVVSVAPLSAAVESSRAPVSLNSSATGSSDPHPTPVIASPMTAHSATYLKLLMGDPPPRQQPHADPGADPADAKYHQRLRFTQPRPELSSTGRRDKRASASHTYE
jgi:hypothetical protein